MRRPPLHSASKLFPLLSNDELQELTEDIRQNGLLNPIVLHQGKILDGRNRWEACQLAKVEPRFTEFTGDDPIAWVVAQNLIRRHLTASQRAVIALDLLPLLENEAKERQRKSSSYRRKGQSAKEFADQEKGKASEMAARLTSSNSRYVEAVKAIRSTSPELIDHIRAGGITVPEARRLVNVRKQRGEEENAGRNPKNQRPWTITADESVIECDVVIADPPYGITQEPWEPADVETFTKGWCSRWAKCGADFIAIFWSQAKLFEGRSWFDQALNGYHFQQLLVWHANNNVAFKDRKCLKQTWEPIFLYRRVGSDRKIVSTSKTWDTERHNGDCFIGAIPQTVYNGEERKMHPCQKPVSVMRWLIHALTEPGEMVASPFAGVSPCGIAAAQLGRRYHGVEIDPHYRQVAEERVAAYGRNTVELSPGKRSRLKNFN